MRRLAILLFSALTGAMLCSEALAQNEVPIAPNTPGYTAPKAREAPRPMERGLSFLGEVQRLDKAAGTVTLKHGSISVLGVQAGTGDYAVKDVSMLERVKVGEAVRFNAVLQGRSLLITTLTPAD